MIEQFGKVLNISADVLYLYAKRVPSDLICDFDNSRIEAAYRAFRTVLNKPARAAYMRMSLILGSCTEGGKDRNGPPRD